MVAEIVHEYRPRGPHRELFGWFADAVEKGTHPPAEMLVEGPAGTAKSRNIIELINWLCETIEADKPFRVLMLRKTRASQNESTLFTLEEEVLWPGHPLLDGASREHRTKYVYPNGNQIILGGMDNPTKLFSTQYDLIYINEANELLLDEYEKLFRANRNFAVPWQSIIVDCNPDVDRHWLNLRPEQPESPMVRVVTRHRDNPAYYNADGTETEHGAVYMRRLKSLTGLRRKRLYEGKWCAAEGMVWENWDPAEHVVDAGPVDPDDTERPWGCNLPPFEWYLCSQDFGWRDANVLQLWGVTSDKRMYRLREFYRTKHGLDWWADRFADWYHKWCIVRCPCDHQPALIDMFNQRIGFRGGRDAGAVAIPAEKGPGSIEAGCDLVRELLGNYSIKDDKTGKMVRKEPRMFFVRQGRDLPDGELRANHLATSTEEEIPGYVFLEQVEDKPVKNRPDPKCQDHGCDATRYAASYVWLYNHAKPAVEKKWHPESYGAWLGHDEVEDVA